MNKTRVRILSICIVLGAMILLTKLYIVQVVNADVFAEKADRQYQRPGQGLFSRGTIYFSDKSGGRITAANMKTGYTIAINPRTIQKDGNGNANSNDVYKGLSSVLEIDADSFFEKAKKPNDSYEEIAKRIDEEKAEKIKAMKLVGVGLYKERWRYYPGESLASHLLGLMGYDKENVFTGRYGLERYYNDTLSRKQDNVYVNFFAELFSNLKNTVVDGEEMEGDVVITIEPQTQGYLEDVLGKLTKQYSAEKAGGIIMDPKTGEIFAMGLTPDFNPNDVRKDMNPGTLNNDLVEGVYEMGSIIKPLTTAVGIDTGKVTASTTYNDTGSVEVDDRTIYNYDKKGRGQVTLQQALSQSLNTGFVFIARKVGNKVLADYFRNFGLGEKTGIDLPHEVTGLISNLSKPGNVEYATASFGQGIAMSPITTVRALATLANGGYLVTPHVTRKIEYKVGFTKDTKPEKGRQVIQPTTAEAVTRMLVNNVDNNLLNGKAKNPHYSVAAKTGTAQIANPRGGYYEDRNMHTFVGYLPAYNPRFIVFMYVTNPKGVGFASETLAKPFFDLSKFLINYYELPPDR